MRAERTVPNRNQTKLIGGFMVSPLALLRAVLIASMALGCDLLAAAADRTTGSRSAEADFRQTKEIIRGLTKGNTLSALVLRAAESKRN